MRRPSGRPPRAVVDFETRSSVDLKKCGGVRYARDPSTRVLVAAWAPALDVPANARPVHVWYPDWVAQAYGLPKSTAPLDDLLRHVEAGGELEAFNAGFDSDVWRHVARREFGWPDAPTEQWHCLDAACRAWGLPGSLQGASTALGLDGKQSGGSDLIKALCHPRKDGAFGGTHEQMVEFLRYAATDVAQSAAVSDRVPDLSPTERRVWLADQRANDRGLPVDEAYCGRALSLYDSWREALNAELRDVTGVERGSQRAKVREWLAGRGLDLPDTTRATVDAALATATDPAVRLALRALRGVNRTSVKKYDAMRAYAGGSGRARRSLVYHGAKTGRWTGKGFQPHNLFKGSVRDMDAACDAVTRFDAAALTRRLGEFLGPGDASRDLGDLLAGTIRGAVAPPEGRGLLVADYAAIEARVLLWLAGDEEGLEILRGGQDIYCHMATDIYGRPITKKDATERQMGKQAVLGLGYGMGDVTFLTTLKSYDIAVTAGLAMDVMGRERYREGLARTKARLDPGPDADRDERLRAKRLRAKLGAAGIRRADAEPGLTLCRYVVAVYRSKRSAVKRLWDDLDAAAKRAARGAGPVVAGRCAWYKSVVDGALECRLPSGRVMRYHSPRVVPVRTSWGEDRAQLAYRTPGKDGKSMVWASAYGGLLAENITQATARDIMAEAMLRADEDPRLDPVMSVHDELVCEADWDAVSPEEYGALVAAVPDWAEGCPVAAEGHRLRRYRK